MKHGTQDGCMHPSVALHTEEEVPCTEGAPMCALKAAKVARICRRQRALQQLDLTQTASDAAARPDLPKRALRNADSNAGAGIRVYPGGAGTLRDCPKLVLHVRTRGAASLPYGMSEC
jgi:hypothetical protein